MPIVELGTLQIHTDATSGRASLIWRCACGGKANFGVSGNATAACSGCGYVYRLQITVQPMLDPDRRN